MLIERVDISNDVITLGTCFHVFFYVCLHSRSLLLGADWRKYDSSVDGEPQRNWRWNSNSKLQALLPFPAPPPGHPGALAVYT